MKKILNQYKEQFMLKIIFETIFLGMFLGFLFVVYVIAKGNLDKFLHKIKKWWDDL